MVCANPHNKNYPAPPLHLPHLATIMHMLLSSCARLHSMSPTASALVRLGVRPTSMV